jgi:multiple sugar transport system substrate-binding protein
MAAAATGCAPRGGDTEPIRFWAMGREGEVVGELVRDFERENPGLTVEVQQIPWTAAHEKLLTAHVGGSTPDLAQLGNTWIPEFVALEALAPLEERISASGAIRPAAYFDGIWATNQVEGATYGVPWYVDTRLLFYRSDLLARAGYDSIPGTWSQWRAALEAVKRERGEGRFAIFLPTNEWTQIVVLGLQAGSPLLGDDATHGVFRGPEFRSAFEFYVDQFRAGLAPAIGSNEIANLYQEFERGYFAMFVTGPWNLGELRRRLPEAMQSAWRTAPLPGPTGPESGVSLAGGSSFVLFRNSKRQEDAWRLVEYLSRPEVQVRFYELSGNLPARRAAWSDTTIARDPLLEAFAVQLERVVPTPRIPEWERIATRVLEAGEQAVRGGRTVDQVLADLDRDVDRMLEKRRWLLERAAATRAAASPPGSASGRRAETGS